MTDYKVEYEIEKRLYQDLLTDYTLLCDERDRYREALEDFRDHGMRFDLNPTYNFNEPHIFFHSYIRRMDESIRERAKAALTPAGGGQNE